MSLLPSFHWLHGQCAWNKDSHDWLAVFMPHQVEGVRIELMDSGRHQVSFEECWILRTGDGNDPARDKSMGETLMGGPFVELQVPASDGPIEAIMLKVDFTGLKQAPYDANEERLQLLLGRVFHLRNASSRDPGQRYAKDMLYFIGAADGARHPAPHNARQALREIQQNLARKRFSRTAPRIRSDGGKSFELEEEAMDVVRLFFSEQPFFREGPLRGKRPGDPVDIDVLYNMVDSVATISAGQSWPRRLPPMPPRPFVLPVLELGQEVNQVILGQQYHGGPLIKNLHVERIGGREFPSWDWCYEDYAGIKVEVRLVVRTGPGGGRRTLHTQEGITFQTYPNLREALPRVRPPGSWLMALARLDGVAMGTHLSTPLR